MGRKKKGSHRIEWTVSERVGREAAVTARELKALGRSFVRHVMPGLGELPLSPRVRPVFFPRSEFVIGAAKSSSGSLLLHLVHRDELVQEVMPYRAYLSPLMKAGGVDPREVREVVESCLRSRYPDPQAVPESPDGTVCRHPGLPWRMYLYRAGGCLHVHCHLPGEPNFDVTLDGYVGIDRLGEAVEGLAGAVTAPEPARDGINKLRPLGGWYDLCSRPSNN